MDQGKNAKIKKLIEELHAKRNPDHGKEAHDASPAPKAKGVKGAKQAGRYRPKI